VDFAASKQWALSGVIGGSGGLGGRPPEPEEWGASVIDRRRPKVAQDDAGRRSEEPDPARDYQSLTGDISIDRVGSSDDKRTNEVLRASCERVAPIF
jgi:hypothetical protein